LQWTHRATHHATDDDRKEGFAMTAAAFKIDDRRFKDLVLYVFNDGG
jgi:hypothetical protein